MLFRSIRSFAFASVISREYRHKPLVVVGAYGFAAAVAATGAGPNQSPKNVIIGAAIGEFIGRVLIHRTDK